MCRSHRWTVLRVALASRRCLRVASRVRASPCVRVPRLDSRSHCHPSPILWVKVTASGRIRVASLESRYSLMPAKWCDVCRGDAEGSADLLKCARCPKRFHLECTGLKILPNNWVCSSCEEAGCSKRSVVKEHVRAVRAVHKRLREHASTFYRRAATSLAPFVPAEKLAQLQQGGAVAAPLTIGAAEPYVKAALRPYQVDGVNWLLRQYAAGTGGILGDEMGLGKTIQTLAFLAALKHAGLPGPHLVVTPLAVLQNWANELKRFTPGLSFVKVHGGLSERDRLLTDDAVLNARFDVYLTTYDTLRAEEAFFTEGLLFHTITIDEGHRLKNEASSLCASLGRISVPFRLLLTGTPLQNNLHELWALLSYILPGVLVAADEKFDRAASLHGGSMDRDGVARARNLLECLMIRRVKSQVESSLVTFASGSNHRGAVQWPRLLAAAIWRARSSLSRDERLFGPSHAAAEGRVRSEATAHGAAASMVHGAASWRRPERRRARPSHGAAASREDDAAVSRAPFVKPGSRRPPQCMRAYCCKLRKTPDYSL